MPDALWGVVVIFAGIMYFAVDLVPGWLDKKKNQTQGRELNPTPAFSQEELGKYYLLLTKKPHQVVLGEHARYQHTQVIGASGTGKTYTGLFPWMYQDIKRGAGVINFDVKSNMDEVMLNYARTFGREHDFFRFQAKDPAGSMSYNPFIGDNSLEVANRVWTAFYQDDKTPTAFYREIALSWTRAFFGQCSRLGVLPTMAQMQLCLMDQTVLGGLIEQASDTEEAYFLNSRYMSISKTKYSEGFEGYVNKLTPLVSGPFGRLLETTEPQIVMKDIILKRRLLYFGLAADLYPADYKILSTMALMDLQSTLTHRYGTNEAGIFVYLDEFGDLVYKEFKTLVAKAREAKVGLILAHQAIGDLKAISDAFADSMMSNTSNKVIYRVGTPETAEAMARLGGTKTVTKDMINYALVDNVVGQNMKAKGLTEVTDDEFILHPNLIKNLPVGHAVMIVQRMKGRELHHGEMIPRPETKHRFAAPFNNKTAPTAVFTPLRLAKTKKTLAFPGTPHNDAAPPTNG